MINNIYVFLKNVTKASAFFSYRCWRFLKHFKDYETLDLAGKMFLTFVYVGTFY